MLHDPKIKEDEMAAKLLDWLKDNKATVFVFLAGFATGVLISNFGWVLK